MCGKTCFTTCWGFVLVIMAIVAISTPWYFSAVEFKTGSEDCKVVTSIGWFQRYCSSSGCNTGVVDCPSAEDWRSDDACDNSQCSHRIKVMNGTFALIFLTLLLSTTAGIYNCVRGCSANKNKSKLHIAAAVVASLFSFIAVVYFGVDYPRALGDDHVCDGAVAASDQCSSLYGTKTLYPSPGQEVILAWGGAGWICGVVLLVVNLVAICVASLTFESPTVLVVHQYNTLPESGNANYGATYASGPATQYT